MIKFPHTLFLTFDVEDFINVRSIDALNRILKLLKTHHQKALFFITGHMIEKLVHFPKIVNLLEEHEIGYHSTSHSVHPTIFEYTDVDSYQEAYRISLSREVAHIDPISGSIEGRGGIELLREVFPQKRIESFRAPGFCWSPPHLEALAHLGIKYDFSTDISNFPVSYKMTTFFPYPSFVDSVLIGGLLRSISKKEVTVLDFHPNFVVNKDWWDSIFFSKTNPEAMSGATPREADQVQKMFRKFEKVLGIVDLLRKLKTVNLCNEARESELELDFTKLDVAKVYSRIAMWPTKRFNYQPKFIYSHLLHFFGLSAGSQALRMHLNNSRMIKSE